MPDEYDSLVPGRDADALIAERVEGWRREKCGKDYDGRNGDVEVLVPPTLGDEFRTYLPHKDLRPVHLGYFAPQYTTDKRAALELMERLQARGAWVSVNTTCDKGQYDAMVAWDGCEQVAVFRPFGLAIGVAALRVANARQPHEGKEG